MSFASISDRIIRRARELNLKQKDIAEKNWCEQSLCKQLV